MSPVRLNLIGLSDTYAALSKESYTQGTVLVVEGTGHDALISAYRYCADGHKEVVTSGEHWFGGHLKWELVVRW